MSGICLPGSGAASTGPPCIVPHGSSPCILGRDALGFEPGVELYSPVPDHPPGNLQEWRPIAAMRGEFEPSPSNAAMCLSLDIIAAQ